MDLKSRSVSNVNILKLSGRFDALNAPRVKEWLEKTLTPKQSLVLIDLDEVPFVDSTALATLVAGMKRSRQMNGDLRLCGLQRPVRMVFELTRLDKAFEIYPAADDAMRAFKSWDNQES